MGCVKVVAAALGVFGHGRAARDERFARRQGGQHGGKFHAEYCTAILAVITKNFAAVFLHDAKANAQSEARALADWLGGVERIKHAVWLLDSGTSIGKQDHHVGAVAYSFDG